MRAHSTICVSLTIGIALACAINACSDDPAPATPVASPDGSTTTTPDGSSNDQDTGPNTITDAGKEDAPANAKCPGPIVTAPGETCIGFGPKPETCDPSCGQPYGFICFEGAPPGFTGCREQRVSAVLGNTYCCPKNDCVAMPDRDSECASTAGKPHRFQCPPLGDDPDGGDAGFATPANGCVEKGSGTTELERFYCCP